MQWEPSLPGGDTGPTWLARLFRYTDEKNWLIQNRSSFFIRDQCCHLGLMAPRCRIIAILTASIKFFPYRISFSLENSTIYSFLVRLNDGETKNEGIIFASNPVTGVIGPVCGDTWSNENVSKNLNLGNWSAWVQSELYEEKYFTEYHETATRFGAMILFLNFLNYHFLPL